jgi:DNA-binding transcriptional ArsR family regulator
MASRASRRQPVGRRLDLIFRALGDETRRKVLARLASHSATITELAEPFAMSLPAVSRHIRVLEKAHLVHRTVEGRVHHCRLDPGSLREVDLWLRHYRQFWDESLESLARYIED